MRSAMPTLHVFQDTPTTLDKKSLTSRAAGTAGHVRRKGLAAPRKTILGERNNNVSKSLKQPIRPTREEAVQKTTCASAAVFEDVKKKAPVLRKPSHKSLFDSTDPPFIKELDPLPVAFRSNVLTFGRAKAKEEDSLKRLLDLESGCEDEYKQKKDPLDILFHMEVAEEKRVLFPDLEEQGEDQKSEEGEFSFDIGEMDIDVGPLDNSTSDLSEEESSDATAGGLLSLSLDVEDLGLEDEISEDQGGGPHEEQDEDILEVGTFDCSIGDVDSNTFFE